MLHIIKSVQALNDAVNAFSKDDELLLIEDAVYAANPQHHAYPLLDGHCCSVSKARSRCPSNNKSCQCATRNC